MSTNIQSPYSNAGVGTVAATDASIVVTGTATAPTIATGTLDVIATQHPAAAAVGLNSQKITSLANGSAATDAAAFGQIIAKQAATSTSGYTLVNGTGTIITWTTPNDGALHRAMMFGSLNVTTPETGGQIQMHYTDPGGTANATPMWPGGQSGVNTATAKLVVCKANTAVTISQDTALTAGAAVAYCEIWGS